MGALAGIFLLWFIVRLFSSIFRGVSQSVSREANRRRKAAILRDLERKTDNVEKQLARLEKECQQPLQYDISVNGTGEKIDRIIINGADKVHHMTINGVDIPIKNAMHLSNKEFMEQEKRIAMVEKIARDKERHEWAKERQEWARQKEEDRRQELEWKRKQREQIDKERKAAEQDGAKQRKRETERRIARADLDFVDQSLQDLTPLVDEYREQFENCLNGKARMSAYKKLYQLEQRQNNLDKRRMKALYTIGGA